MLKFQLTFRMVALSVCMMATSTVQASSWAATRIDDFGSGSYAYKLNATGVVAGFSYIDPWTSHAFMTGPNGSGITDLGTLGGRTSIAFSINNSGQIVGLADNASGSNSAFITGSNGEGMIDLNALNNASNIYPYDINSHGRVVGQSGNFAFITSPGGGNIKYIGTLGGFSSEARSVNENGLVVGSSSTEQHRIHAFLYDSANDELKDLGTLGGLESQAQDINSRGDIVGFSYTNEYPTQRAFIIDYNNASMRDLGTLGGVSSSSSAFGVNSIGQVVGTSATFSSDSHAFITAPDGGEMFDLNTMTSLPEGVFLTHAHAINDAGQIIATGNDRNYYFLSLTSIPEPNSFFLMLMGLIALLLAKKRKWLRNMQKPNCTLGLIRIAT